jgi:hypothetical protein
MKVCCFKCGHIEYFLGTAAPGNVVKSAWPAQ